MRLGAFLSAAVLVMVSGLAAAQSSPPFYINRESRFAIIFPAAPTAKDITYTTRSGASYPARQFTVDQNGNQHIMTVVNVSTGPAVDIQLVNQAADALRARGEVRFQAEEEYDPGLPGRQLNIFQSDGRQLRASVYMWEHRLFITEANGAPGALSLFQFEQSITLLDADGNEVNLDADRFAGRGGRGGP
jgi:hypothetical protein